VTLEFQRYLNVESPTYDHAYIDIWNGSSWNEIFTNSAGIEDDDWSLHSFDISAYADDNIIKIRFAMGESDGSWQYSGWNIDDLVVSGMGQPSGLNDNNLTRTTVLHQNYPNPFNPITSISYFNNVSGELKLTVYNVKGELVVSLVNQKNSVVGSKTVKFDASSFNSGVYYYKLETPEKTLIKKMILVK